VTTTTLRAWDLAAGAPRGDPIAAHDGAVNAVAAIEHGRRPLMVSGGEDETVRVWNLAGSELCRITVDSPVHAIAARGGTFVLSADAGIMAIEVRVPARVR
jgi:WD40 repeat protein